MIRDDWYLFLWLFMGIHGVVLHTQQIDTNNKKRINKILSHIVINLMMFMCVPFILFISVNNTSQPHHYIIVSSQEETKPPIQSSADIVPSVNCRRGKKQIELNNHNFVLFFRLSLHYNFMACCDTVVNTTNHRPERPSPHYIDT